MDVTTAFWIIILLPLLASPVVYLAGRLVVRRYPARNPARWVALVFLLAEGLFVYLAGQAYLTRHQFFRFLMGAVSMEVDAIGLLLAAVVVLLGFFVILFSGPYMRREEGEEKFYALLLVMIGTIVGLGFANDLFNLWVWFEAMAISSYMLVAFYREQRSSLEAGVKYLLQSAVGSVFVLLAIALVFADTGVLDLEVIRMNAHSHLTMLAAGGLFVIGFGVKTALVPLHTWLPDAHSQAPSGISAMLSGIVIETGLVAMLRALGSLTTAGFSWGSLLLGFGALNMLYGNLMALRQTQVKRLLAYSSLSHMGYILLGIGAAVSFGKLNSAAGGFFHLITHGMMKGLAFLAAGALLYSLYIANGKHRPLTVEDLNGASRRYPLAAFGLSLAVLGLGGLPPLAGFMSKWQIFVGGFETRNPVMILLVIFAALNSVLSLGYYAPLVNRMYRLQPSPAVEKGKPTPFLIGLPLAVLSLLVAVLGFWPSLVNWLTAPAARDLLAAFGL
jgi:proton-translocating NADH-quinone oxidoreductase chain N